MLRTTGTRATAGRLGVAALGAVLLLGACGEEPAVAPGESAGVATVAAEPVVRTVGPSEALDLVASGSAVVDVRTPEEFAAGHVDGAVNIDLQSEDFLDRVQALPADEPYVVYCVTGNRSGQAVELMAAEGFDELYDAGAFGALADAGVEVAKAAPE